MPTAPDPVYEAASRDYYAARKVFRWWLAGLVYGVFCLFGRYLPRNVLEGLGGGLLILLNRHGAALAALVCTVGAAVAFREERRKRAYLTAILIARTDERIAARRAAEATTRAGDPG